MLDEIPASTRRLGFGAAVLATAFSLTYLVAQLAEWAGWLGSALAIFFRRAKALAPAG